MSLSEPYSGHRILIVENELLVGEMIRRRLTKRNYEVVGLADTYEAAVALQQRTAPDVVLIDVHLRGTKTGVDFAHHLRSVAAATPFIFLTAQADPVTMAQVRFTQPAGYLIKPIQLSSLYTTIDIAIHNHRQRRKPPTITLKDSGATHVIPLSQILYLEADHVYVKVRIEEQLACVMCRATLTDLLSQLPGSCFVQTHRSFAVNLDHVTRYYRNRLYLQNIEVPVSRSRREAVLARMRLV